MELFVKDMTEELARQILCWTYEEPYELYNNELTDEAMKEILHNGYFAVVDNTTELVGYFCIGDSAQVPIGSLFGVYRENLIDIGIGMKPELTGKGLGYTFFSFILDQIKETFDPISVRLTVVKSNTRAIHLYQKFGFVREDEFNQETFEFITMTMKDNKKSASALVSGVWPPRKS
jgi:[ribosomal protein S18]-alanine N-acetyltransferase